MRAVRAVALLALLGVGSPVRAAEPHAVVVTGVDGLALKAYFIAPAASPITGPAIVALHGCGGNFRPDGRLQARVPDWTERFLAAGYAVVWPDSFGSRGLGPQCGVSRREINPAKRADDAVAAAQWIAAQPGIAREKIALIGWSNGGSTVLHTVSAARAPAAVEFKTAIAFYPGCRVIAERPGFDGKSWSARLPTTILMGAADDWTPPAPCRDLGRRPPARYVEYPGAYHDFDAPNLPVRVRTGLAFTAGKSGVAHVGTDPAARAAAIAETMRILSEAFR